MSNSKNFIGVDEYGTYIFQRTSAGMIKGFDGYDLVELVDGSQGFSWCESMHEKTIDGSKHSSGDAALPSGALPEELENVYFYETVSCEECGVTHDSESSPSTWTIVGECSAVCLGCRTAEDALVELSEPSDLFKAKNLEDVDLTDFEEIETLFCDSSGLGSPGERALTRDQALREAARILEESSEPMYAGITGIGQFQVYVSVFRRAA